MDHKIIVFDLDGTLLNASHQITTSTLEIIKVLKSMGHYIVINTGRSYNACNYYSKLIKADYTVACNGAFTYDHKECIIRNKLPLDKQLSRQILMLLYEKQSYLKIQWDSIATYYSNNITPFESFYIENYKRDYPEDIFHHKIINDYKDIKELDEEIYQIFFHPMDNNKDGYKEVLQELNRFKELNIVDFKNECTDINHKLATKGNALKSLADALCIPRERVIVFGDGDNDISMFKYAGFAVAMDNACEEIKDLSHMIALNHDQEGVASALENIFQLKQKTS